MATIGEGDCLLIHLPSLHAEGQGAIMATDPTQSAHSLGGAHAFPLSTGSDARHAAKSHAPMRADAAGLACAQSKRMRLRGIGYEDIPQLSRLFAQTKQHPLLMASPTRFIDVAAIVACANRIYTHAPGLGVWRADALDGTFIGLFSLVPIEGGSDVEIHVRLTPEAWGHWYAIEGTHLLCRQAFDALGLPRLFGYCHPDYRRIRQIMTRFGFSDLGLREHRGQVALCYELDAAKWRERGQLAETLNRL